MTQKRTSFLNSAWSLAAALLLCCGCAEVDPDTLPISQFSAWELPADGPRIHPAPRSGADAACAIHYALPNI